MVKKYQYETNYEQDHRIIQELVQLEILMNIILNENFKSDIKFIKFTVKYRDCDGWFSRCAYEPETINDKVINECIRVMNILPKMLKP